MMKKLVLILALCLLCSFTFTACKNDEQTVEDNPTNDNQNQGDNNENDDNQNGDNQNDDNKDEVVYSEGLEFTSNGDGTCYVSGLGTCAETNINIPPVSPDGNKVTGIGKHLHLMIIHIGKCAARTAVNLDNGGIFFVGLVVDRLHRPAVNFIAVTHKAVKFRSYDSMFFAPGSIQVRHLLAV